MKILPNLDVLRFFLASLVIVFHVPQLCKNQGLPYYDALPIFHRGVEAVYMFFTLSGFLIIRLIYKAKQNDSFSIKNFYVRRVLRIFPLYFLILIFGLIFYNALLPFLNIPFETNYTLMEGILLCVFFLPNVFAELYEPGGILEILWSIGIEEQFYLMIAPLLFFISKNKVLLVLILLSVGYFILFHLPFFVFLREFKFVYFYLFFGGIIAILEEKKKLEFLKKSFVFPLIISILALLYFITDVFQFEEQTYRNLLTMIVFGLFVHTLAFNNRDISIKNNVINHFGKISYGIYMYHVIALNLVVFLFLKVEVLQSFGSIATIILINVFTFLLTLIFAHISYTYFETYFLKLKNNFRK